MESVELNDLVGEHLLSGVDHEQVQVKIYGDSFEDANAIRFVLDGKIYLCTESPDDGYRSSMESLQIVTEPPVKNVFPPVRVVARKAAHGSYEQHDYLEFIAVANGEIVLEVGTANTDDYYPWFVGKFSPDRLPVNTAKGAE